MRVGLVRRGYSSSGGAESFLLLLADGLAAAGHSPVLFTGDGWPAHRWPHGDPVRIADGSPMAFANHLQRSDPWKRCEFLLSLERVWKCDCYRAGDGVHRVWLVRRAPHEPWWRVAARAMNPKHRQILRLETSLFREGGARKIIANSHMVKDEIHRVYSTDPASIAVVHNGLDPGAFAPDPTDRREAARRHWGLDAGNIAVLFTGSGWERKGLAFALQAVAALRIPDVRLLVAGRGNTAKFRRRADESRTRFLGVVDDMPSLYAAADLFVLPTLYDPFSNASLEAAARGLPVITTRFNGFHEIIEPGVHGEVIDNPADIDALAKAIERWLDPEKREAARPAIAERAVNFTIERNVRESLAAVGIGP